jgi:hypothetical protein
MDPSSRYPRIATLALSALLLYACSDSDPTDPADNGPKNHRPVLVELPDTSVTVGNSLVLTTDGSDPDGDPLSFHGAIGASLSDVMLGTLPVFDFESSTRTLTFIPQAYDRPRRTAIFWAEDGKGGVDTMTVRVGVN